MCCTSMTFDLVIQLVAWQTWLIFLLLHFQDWNLIKAFYSDDMKWHKHSGTLIKKINSVIGVESTVDPTPADLNLSTRPLISGNVSFTH